MTESLKPSKTPEEIAREIVSAWVDQDCKAPWRGDGQAFAGNSKLTDRIAAAIRAERQPPNVDVERMAQLLRDWQNTSTCTCGSFTCEDCTNTTAVYRRTTEMLSDLRAARAKPSEWPTEEESNQARIQWAKKMGFSIGLDSVQVEQQAPVIGRTAWEACLKWIKERK